MSSADINKELFERAQQFIPGGVNSPVRSFRSVGGTPYFVKKASGAFVEDFSGNKYLDFVQSYGPIILGHAPKVVLRAVSKAAKRGFSFGAPTKQEIELAEKICKSVKGLEMIRLVSSGTEATMSAIRLARGFVNRDKIEKNQIVKFSGCYHGHADSLLVESGSGLANQSIATSSGVTSGAILDTIVAPYNQSGTNLLAENIISEKTAAVIVEPVAANMGVVAPKPDFLKSLRLACDEVGALLIFDEVITGFRIAMGGAVEVFGVTPDLWCFGKVIGGGLPIGAFGGKELIMKHLAPLGKVYQAGTLSGNPLATTAGLATLNHLDDAAFVELKEKASYLAKGLTKAGKDADIPVSVAQVESLLGIFFTDTLPTNFDEVKQAIEKTGVGKDNIYSKFFHKMLERGIAFAPGAYEAVFLSLAHSYKDLDRTIQVASEVFQEIK